MNQIASQYNQVLDIANFSTHSTAAIMKMYTEAWACIQLATVS